MRLHEPLTVLAIATLVVEARFLVVATRLREHGERVRVDAGLVGRSPADRRDVRVHRGHATTKPVGQHLLELREGADRRVLDAVDRGTGRLAQPDRDRHGLLVVEDEWRQVRARGEPVAAVVAGCRLDRVAELAQPVDVSPDRAWAHLEPRRRAPRRATGGGSGGARAAGAPGRSDRSPQNDSLIIADRSDRNDP